MDTNTLLAEIGDWLLAQEIDLRLVVGVWNVTNRTWYAGITDIYRPKLMYGETSYGSETIEEALAALYTEIHTGGK